MTTIPTNTSSTATTESTSVLELNQLIDIANAIGANGIGNTGSYNYNSATVPVAQQTLTASGMGQNLDHNYSAPGIQISNAPVSQRSQYSMPNPSSISSNLAHDYPLRSLFRNTADNSHSNTPSVVAANTNIPTQSQQPVDYSQSIVSTSSTVRNSTNPQQQILPANPSTSTAFSSYAVVPSKNIKHKTTTPVTQNNQIEKRKKANKIVLRLIKKTDNPSAPNAPTTYVPVASSHVSRTLYVPSTTASYMRAAAATASYIRAASSYVPAASPYVPVASHGTFVTSHATWHTPVVTSQNFATSHNPGSYHSVPVLPSTSGSQDQSTVSMTTFLPVTPSTSPPLPPNWNEHLEETIISLATYKLFPIDSNTLEFGTLAAMMHPLQITEAEQVVNPTLWSRFVNTRKDMLRSKSDDLQLLTKLGLDEAEIMRSAHLSMNFNKDAAVAAYPYNDNMALLFHCTRSKTNVDNILMQGLDERVGNTGGLLGRGVYFADDPMKSMQYDGCGGIMFVFAVLLGDCLSVDHLPNRSSFVKEPDKEISQKRNFNDFTFDSIAARPTLTHNEYVVYNRYQCCPLYKIKYLRKPSFANYRINNTYVECTHRLPSFSWIPAVDRQSLTPMPNPLASTSHWAFYASAVFSQMGVVPKIEGLQAAAVESASSIDDKLAMLSNLGFTDADSNRETLKKYEYDLDRTVNYLLDQSDVMPNEQSEHLPSTPIDFTPMIDLTNSPDPAQNLSHIDTTTEAESTPKTTVNNIDNASEDVLLQDIYDWVVAWKSKDGTNSVVSATEQKSEDCSICCNEYDTNAIHWSVLECSHKVCTSCYKQIKTTRTTMAGVTHTFVKCPFCQGSTGIEIGYEQYSTISIRYDVSSHRLNRTVYIPNNDEGNEVLKLLRIAWDRRLCFTVGTSVTTGRENSLVWNIHHKTAQQGGVQCYGFPDPTYFQRVKLELKAYGIESQM